MVVENQMDLESPYSSKQLINMKMDDQNSLYEHILDGKRSIFAYV